MQRGGQMQGIRRALGRGREGKEGRPLQWNLAPPPRFQVLWPIPSQVPGSVPTRTGVPGSGAHLPLAPINMYARRLCSNSYI